LFPALGALFLAPVRLCLSCAVLYSYEYCTLPILCGTLPYCRCSNRCSASPQRSNRLSVHTVVVVVAALFCAGACTSTLRFSTLLYSACSTRYSYSRGYVSLPFCLLLRTRTVCSAAQRRTDAMPATVKHSCATRTCSLPRAVCCYS
jgi:hypothetical protein